MIILRGITEKVFFCIQSSQRITLRRLNQIAVFIQLNGVQYTCQHYFSLRIGLGNKISRTHHQAIHFSLLICRDHHNRDLSCIITLLQLTKHLQSMQSGHKQIQQDQRQHLCMCMCDRQRFIPVRCSYHVIIILQHHREQFAIDGFIIHYQYLSFSVFGVKPPAVPYHRSCTRFLPVLI